MGIYEDFRMAEAPATVKHFIQEVIQSIVESEVENMSSTTITTRGGLVRLAVVSLGDHSKQPSMIPLWHPVKLMSGRIGIILELGRSTCNRFLYIQLHIVMPEKLWLLANGKHTGDHWSE